MDVSEVKVVSEAKIEPKPLQNPPKPVKEEKTFSYADAAKGKYRHTTESGPPKEGICSKKSKLIIFVISD